MLFLMIIIGPDILLRLQFYTVKCLALYNTVQNLTLSQTTKVWTRPNSKHLQMTSQNVGKMVLVAFDRLTLS